MTNDSGPLVSCIMPTANRRPWVPLAIRYFLRQDYPNRELVILDDGDDPVEELIPADPRIRYKRLTGSRTLGAKRNLCVDASRGDLILHWDDDDWFAAGRIRRQVEALLRTGAGICGQSRMLFHEPSTARTWLYQLPREQRWLAGGSLLYTRELWKRSPFPDVPLGEDTSFIWSRGLDDAATLEECQLYLAMVHPYNTSPKIPQSNWIPWPGDVRRLLGEDYDLYDFARPGKEAGRGEKSAAKQIQRISPRLLLTTGEATEPAVVTEAVVLPAARTDIIVPTFGQENFTVRCFDSLLAHTDAYRLVWVDNGSSSASRTAVLRSFTSHEQRLSIWSSCNLGFVGGTNLALGAILGDFASDAEYVVLLNNDTELTPGWLDRLTAALESNPSIAAAGPMTSPPSPCQAWPDVFAKWGEHPPESLATASPAEVSILLASTFANRVVSVPMVAFFCTVFRKSVFSEIGLLDPRFGAGFGDDDDYCLRLRNAGHDIAFVPGAYVVHHHRTTFRAVYSAAEIHAMQNENLSRYRRKHRLG